MLIERIPRCQDRSRSGSRWVVVADQSGFLELQMKFNRQNLILTKLAAINFDVDGGDITGWVYRDRSCVHEGAGRHRVSTECAHRLTSASLIEMTSLNFKSIASYDPASTDGSQHSSVRFTHEYKQTVGLGPSQSDNHGRPCEKLFQIGMTSSSRMGSEQVCKGRDAWVCR